MTLRDRPGGYEILMLRRNLRSEFVAGAYVFPGGAVDEGDGSAAEVVVGLDDVTASERLSLPGGALAYYVAALRELFEEAGLLLACRRDGTLANGDDVTAAALAAHRRGVNAGDESFLAMLREAGLCLDLRDVYYVAHWTTPVGPPRRYDTRFFVARAPEGQEAAQDDDETVAARWVRPSVALVEHDQGTLTMLYPTVRNLAAIARFERADEVFAWARSLAEIPRIEPQIVDRAGQIHIVGPGDEGFVETPAPGLGG